MGATSADTQREIEEIRKDVTSAVRELKKRVGRATDLGAHSQRAKQHPAALAGLGVAALGVGGAVVARVIAERRRRQDPRERLKRTVLGAAEEIGERLERARESLPFELRLASGDDRNGRETAVEVKGSDPGMVKRMLWAALVATLVAAGGLLARRVSAAIWRAAMQEEPPTASI